MEAQALVGLDLKALPFTRSSDAQSALEMGVRNSTLTIRLAYIMHIGGLIAFYESPATTQCLAPDLPQERGRSG